MENKQNKHRKIELKQKGKQAKKIKKERKNLKIGINNT
jgi:hypothetical protein